VKTLLIIDDDLFVQQAYRDKFTSLGYTVVPAFDHKDVAACIAGTSIPDVIILDIMMPHKDGFEILEEIKEHALWKTIPVIMLTNLDSERERAKQMGVSEYLVKSDTPIAQIVQTIKRIVGE